MELERLRRLYEESRYATIATIFQGTPWAYSVSFVPGPKRGGEIVYYSNEESRHTHAIRNSPRVAGATFLLDEHQMPIDGMQFVGKVSIVDHPDVELHRHYYENSFPDPEVRNEWLIDIGDFRHPGLQRFHRVIISEAWLIDIATWEEDKMDRRVDVTRFLPEL